MERRILTFKTHHEELDSHFLEEIEKKLIECIQTCSLGPHKPSQMTWNEIYTGVVPGWWTLVTSSADIQNRIKCNESFDTKDLTGLGEKINESLDAMCTPGRSLLSLLWICDKVPESYCPSLSGAFNRAVSWHCGEIVVITSNEIDKTPSWLKPFKAKVVPISKLCLDHGLEDVISPTLVWKGNLSVFDDADYTSDLVEGFELHFDRDPRDLILQKIKLSKSDYVKEEEEAPSLQYFGRSLELICAVDPLSVPLNLLTDQRFIIKSTIQENEEIAKCILEEGMSGYIARLRTSKELAKKREEKTTENWRKFLIEGNFDNLEDESYLGESSDSIHFLIYNHAAPVSVRDCGQTVQKSVIMLKNLVDFEDPIVFQPIFQNDVDFQEGVDTAVQDLHVEYTIPPEALYTYKQNVNAEVLQTLLGEKSEAIQTRSIDDLMMGVEEIMEETWFDIIQNRKVDKVNLELDGSLRDPKRRFACQYIDDSSEKRLLKMNKVIKKRQEGPEERDQNLTSRNEDTISLEPKEIVKFFEPNGEPSKSLSLEPVSSGSKCMQYVSEEEYKRILSENFAKLEDEEEFGGFKFKGKDFNILEFTKFYDVFYHNGDKAEQADKDFTRMRDVYVGRSRETSTSLEVHKAPEKLKLNQATAASSRVRRSPRKKIGKSAERRPVPPKHLKKPLKPVNQNLQASLNKKPPNKSSVKNFESRTRVSKAPKESEQSAADLRKKKLRVAVYQSLLEKGVEEKHPIFRKCFSTLFKICQLLHISSSGENTSKILLDVARSNVENVLKAEAFNFKKNK